MEKHFKALDKQSVCHQDWKQVVVNTKPKLKEDKQTTTKKISDSQLQENKLLKKVDNDELSHTKISLELRKQIQQKRSSLGMTQKQLAQRVNFPVSIINEIETGKAIYNPQQINKIKRFLKL